MTNLDAEIIRWIKISKGDLPGHEFHGNQYSTPEAQASELNKISQLIIGANSYGSPDAEHHVWHPRIYGVSRLATSYPTTNPSLNFDHPGMQGDPHIVRDSLFDMKPRTDAGGPSKRQGNGWEAPFNEPFYTPKQIEGAKAITKELLQRVDGIQKSLKLSQRIYADNGKASNAFNSAAGALGTAKALAKGLSRIYAGARPVEITTTSPPYSPRTPAKETKQTVYPVNGMHSGELSKHQDYAISMYHAIHDAQMYLSQAHIALAEGNLQIIKGDLPGHIFHGNQYEQAENAATVARTAEAAIPDLEKKFDDADMKYEELYEEMGIYTDDRLGAVANDLYSDREIEDEFDKASEEAEKSKADYMKAIRQAGDGYALMSYFAKKNGDNETADAYAEKSAKYGKIADSWVGSKNYITSGDISYPDTW